MLLCLFGMVVAAQLSLLGIWLGCGRYRWFCHPVLGLLPVFIAGTTFLFLPSSLKAYYISQADSSSRPLVSGTLIILAPGHLLGALLGVCVLRLYDLHITREPASPIRFARRFQFSTHRIFLLVTVFAVMLGIGVWCYHHMTANAPIKWRPSWATFRFLIAAFRAAFWVVGPPAFIAPLAVWSALSTRSPYPRLAIALVVVLTVAFSIVGVPRAYAALPRGGEFLIAADELSVLRSKGYRLALPGSGNRGKAFASPARRVP